MKLIFYYLISENVEIYWHFEKLLVLVLNSRLLHVYKIEKNQIQIFIYRMYCSVVTKENFQGWLFKSQLA